MSDATPYWQRPDFLPQLQPYLSVDPCDLPSTSTSNAPGALAIAGLALCTERIVVW